MDFGIALATTADSWKLVKRAEELGFSHAWFYDTQMLSADCFVAMGAAAVNTDRIRLGTGVLIPSNRIPAVTANAFATLNQLAPGRIDFGVGTGFTGRRAMGFGAMKLADMAEYIRVVYGLLAGEKVETTFEGKPARIKFLNPEAGCINIDDPVRLTLSAMGPKGRRLTAKLKADWMTFTNGPEPAGAQLADMQAAWAEAGHAASELYAAHFALGCVLDEDEPADSPRAIAQAGPRAMVQLHRAVDEAVMGLPNTQKLPDWLAELRDRYVQAAASFDPEEPDRYLVTHKGHLMFVRLEERRFATADLIRYTSFTGTEAEIKADIEALRAAGYRQFTVQLVPGQEDAIADWARIMQAFA
ncbi:MAG: LLM class flavin-dependent oxidoreductase [Alphaproteobacteria bacterium]|nr:LLM class flavin-dependent oxidoreductase [Alphaproteobacteria bacterium]MCB9927884.1 LLM class flavin-dependent oxidoreductase [Alphaproteobacteria bacterium]